MLDDTNRIRFGATTRLGYLEWIVSARSPNGTRTLVTTLREQALGSHHARWRSHADATQISRSESAQRCPLYLTREESSGTPMDT